MRRGCTSLGDISCDECHRTIPHGERYLIIEGQDGVELRLCVECSLNRGYARYRKEKGKEILTFFPGEDDVQ